MTRRDLLVDMESERAYLAHALFDASILDAHALRPDDLYGASNALLLAAALAVHERREPVGIDTLHAELARRGDLTRVGGDEALLDLTNTLPTSGAASAVRARLLTLSTLRRRRDALRAALAACESQDLAATDAAIADLASRPGVPGEAGAYTLFECAAFAWQELAAKPALERAIVPTGIRSLDDAVGGLTPGMLLVLGGDTGVGKSSALLAMALGIAATGRRVGIVSCEDPRDVWGARAIAALSGVSSNSLRAGKLHPHEFNQAAAATDRLRDQGVYLDFRIGDDDTAVASSMTRLVREHGCQIVMVDYLQTINYSGRADTRREVIRVIASRLKGCAARLSVPLMLASQLSRPGADEKFREPHKHHLKESGDVENMAEVIVLLWRTEAGGEDDIHAKVGKSKWGGDGQRWILRRDSAGILREVEGGQ